MRQLNDTALLRAKNYFGFRSTAYVEKDYVICEFLGKLAKKEPPKGYDFVFGGGAAVSKAYGYIDRMSECSK